MKVLAVKNISIEGLGTFENFIRNLGYSVDYTDASELKQNMEDYEALIILGGPMGVYEYEKFPFLLNEFKLAEKAIKEGKKVLGICLGAQIIAHVLGARVYKGDKGKEIGWYKVKNYGEFEKLFDEESLVFQWHGDTFDLPSGCTRLSSSEKYENQAFKYGDNVYAIQYHLEVTKEDIKTWINAYKEEVKSENLKEADILGEDENWKHLKELSRKFISHFLEV